LNKFLTLHGILALESLNLFSIVILLLKLMARHTPVMEIHRVLNNCFLILRGHLLIPFKNPGITFVTSFPSKNS
jgi:hypothetical protein